MAFERKYQVKIPSKQLNPIALRGRSKCFYSLVPAIGPGNNNLTKLNPYFVSGFVDAEGYFGTSIYKNKKLKTG